MEVQNGSKKNTGDFLSINVEHNLTAIFKRDDNYSAKRVPLVEQFCQFGFTSVKFEYQFHCIVPVTTTKTVYAHVMKQHLCGNYLAYIVLTSLQPNNQMNILQVYVTHGLNYIAHLVNGNQTGLVLTLL